MEDYNRIHIITLDGSETDFSIHEVCFVAERENGLAQVHLIVSNTGERRVIYTQHSYDEVVSKIKCWWL